MVESLVQNQQTYMAYSVACSKSTNLVEITNSFTILTFILLEIQFKHTDFGKIMIV